MGGDWTDTTLGNVLTLQRGFDLPESDRKAGPYPVIASTGPVGTHDKAMVQGPGVVIGRSGSLGGGQFIQGDFWPLNTTLWVKDFKGNDRRFCYYLLKSLDLAHFNAGSGVPTLNRNHIHPLPVTVPTDPREQRTIAHILGTLDDKIELNRQMSETLEAMARALFKSWFVDFDPVRAKCRGDLDGRPRWRRGESLPGLPAHLYDLFPDRLVDSELGEIPEGWEVKPFGDLLVDSIGGDWGEEESDELHTESIAVIRGTDIPDVDSAGVGKVPIRYTTRGKLDKRQLEDGDIIIEVSGGSPKQPTGRSLLVTQHIIDRFPTAVVCASFCRRFRPVSQAAGIFLSQHLTWLYRRGGTWEYQNQSTGIANFQTSRFLESEPIVWPDEWLMNEYVELVDPIIRRRSVNETLKLTALRDTLLPKLISGALRVKDAEKFLAERGL